MTGTVLVTGGAGYIGSHACLELARSGFVPVALDDLRTGSRRLVRFGPLVVGDVRDASVVARALEEHRPVAVMHFAASAYVGESMADPLAYWDNNVRGLVSVLEAMRDHGPAAMVFSSSCATYGVPDVVPVPDDHPQRPVSPYGRTKLAGEQVLRDVEQANGIRSVALRYFNAAGADPDGEVGELHDPETHLVPLALAVAAGERAALDVNGTHHPTPDGTCVRDYVHVSDLARAHVLALEHLLGGGASVALNLGSGSPASVLEVVAAVREVTGRPVPTRDAPPRPGDPPALYAQATGARDLLGWRPERSRLETIVEDAWRWRTTSDTRDPDV